MFGESEDDHRVDACRIGDHGPIEWAEFLATQAATILVLVAKDVIPAFMPHHFLCRPAGDSLGGFTPI